MPVGLDRAAAYKNARATRAVPIVCADGGGDADGGNADDDVLNFLQSSDDEFDD